MDSVDSYNKNEFKKFEKIEIGHIFKSIRKSLGYTQEQVAEKLFLAPRYISDIERNKTNGSLDTLVRLCNLYNLTPTFVLRDYLNMSDCAMDKNLIGYYSLDDYEKSIIQNLIRFMNSEKHEKMSYNKENN